MYEIALEGEFSSRLANKLEVAHLDDVVRTTDVVETFVPLRGSPEGELIGVLEIYRDVSRDVGVQVSDTKTTVLWTTLTAMGLLFVVLAGFVVL